MNNRDLYIEQNNPRKQRKKTNERIEKLGPINESKYENVDLNHLVMYAMGQLEEINADLSFENAVVAAFKIFPKKFSLLGFPEYPDSTRVEKRLRDCADRRKQWLGGKIRQGFVITNRGRRFIKEAENYLNGLYSEKTKAPSQTRRKESLLAEVTSSPAYLKHIKGQRDSISVAEFCFLLQGTLDSSREFLERNLTLLRQFSEELGRKDILEFLVWLEEHFAKFLGNK